MRFLFLTLLTIGWIQPAFAADQELPWFGSDGQAPEQLELEPQAVSSMDTVSTDNKAVEVATTVKNGLEACQVDVCEKRNRAAVNSGQ